MSQFELSVYFWLNCLNFKLAELSVSELSVRHINTNCCNCFKASYIHHAADFPVLRQHKFMMQNLILKLNLFENLNFVKFAIQNFIGG